MRTRVRLAPRILAVAIATALAATLINAAPAQANEAADSGLAADGTPSHELDQSIERLTPYVSRSAADGTFSLSAPPRMIESIDTAVYASVVDGMTLVNSMISGGALISTENLQAFPVGTVTRGQESGADAGILSHGATSFSCAWYGCTLKLSAFWTGKLIDALNVGGQAATVAAVLAAAGVFTSPGAVPSAVTAGILFLGAGVIKLCSNSHGVWIRFGPAAWCGGQ